MQLFANAARTVTTAVVASAATSIPVADATRFPTGGTGDWFRLVLESATDPSVFEIVTARRTGATELTVVARAQEGTAAQDWPMGTIAGLRVTAADIDGKQAAMVVATNSANANAANGTHHVLTTAGITLTAPATPADKFRFGFTNATAGEVNVAWGGNTVKGVAPSPTTMSIPARGSAVMEWSETANTWIEV